MNLDGLKKLDGTAIKLIAMVCMVMDHVGELFFPHTRWMRAVGRAAFPVFAFCICEGYVHTRSKYRYLLRLGIFALISELPFDLAVYRKPSFRHQNVMMTFFLAVIGLLVFDRIRGEKKENGRYDMRRELLGMAVVTVIGYLALKLHTDYQIIGVLSVLVFYLCHEAHPLWYQFSGGIFLVLSRTKGMFAWTWLGLLLLALYNGKKGRGLKWLFYWFYPGHLFLLYLLKTIL